MDYAVDRGVNFFDTAELYSIPPKAETQGSTETIIGTWFKKNKNRDKIILATKVAGRSGMDWFRGGETRLDKKNIEAAIEGSLKRLQTDYVDLYQLHWPMQLIQIYIICLQSFQTPFYRSLYIFFIESSLSSSKPIHTASTGNFCSQNNFVSILVFLKPSSNNCFGASLCFCFWRN